jgi:hypothetical protein
MGFLGDMKNFRYLWDGCERSDWFLWLLENAKYDEQKLLRIFACKCVRKTPYGDGVAWDYLKDIRSKAAIIEVENYFDNKANMQDVKDASDFAWTVPARKDGLELIPPMVADLSIGSMMIAQTQSWRLAVISGKIKKALKVQADIIRQVIPYKDMERCAEYLAKQLEK